MMSSLLDAKSLRRWMVWSASATALFVVACYAAGAALTAQQQRGGIVGVTGVGGSGTAGPAAGQQQPGRGTSGSAQLPVLPGTSTSSSGIGAPSPHHEHHAEALRPRQLPRLKDRPAAAAAPPPPEAPRSDDEGGDSKSDGDALQLGRPRRRALTSTNTDTRTSRGKKGKKKGKNDDDEEDEHEVVDKEGEEEGASPTEEAQQGDNNEEEESDYGEEERNSEESPSAAGDGIEREEEAAVAMATRTAGETATGEEVNNKVDFKPVLLTFLVPHQQRHSDRLLLRYLSSSGSKVVTLDQGELVSLTSRHLLAELRLMVIRREDVQDVELKVSPVELQAATETTSSVSLLAISMAIDGRVGFLPGLVIGEDDVQSMVERAFDGEALDRFERRLQVFSVDPSIRSIRSIHVGLPSDAAAAAASAWTATSTTSGGAGGGTTKANWLGILIAIAVVGFALLTLLCCVAVQYCRQRRRRKRHHSDERETKSPPSDKKPRYDSPGDKAALAETVDHHDDDSGAGMLRHLYSDPFNMSRTQSYQLSEAMSVYIENNIVTAEEEEEDGQQPSSNAIEPQVPTHGSDLGEDGEQGHDEEQRQHHREEAFHESPARPVAVGATDSRTDGAQAANTDAETRCAGAGSVRRAAG